MSKPTWPVIVPRPRQPDLSDGLCQAGRSALPAAAWTGADPELREAARRVCQCCPVLGPCRAWGLDATAYADNSIIGGTDKREREAARRERRAVHDGVMSDETVTQPETAQADPAAVTQADPATAEATQGGPSVVQGKSRDTSVTKLNTSQPRMLDSWSQA